MPREVTREYAGIMAKNIKNFLNELEETLIKEENQVAKEDERRMKVLSDLIIKTREMKKIAGLV